ncbi:MAG: PKD domain-containing protein, partial [Bacteroidetes bacterium]
VSDNNGCEHSISKNNLVVINPAQVVNFTGNNLSSCNPPLTSSFFSSVAPAGNYTYLWSTSNGLTSTSANPSFTFTTPGEFDVTLKVTNSLGCVETITKPKFVKVLNTIASFSISPQPVCLGDDINLTNTSVPDSPGATYSWKVNNLPVVTTKNHRILNPPLASYNITLTHSFNGCTATSTQQVTVNPLPVVSFTAQPDIFCKVPTTVQFTNTTPSGAGYLYSWDFGNGQTSTNVNGSATYNNQDIYQVKLKATDANGCTKEATSLVRYRKPIAEIEGQNSKTGCKPYTANFSLTISSDQFVSYEWTYNNTIISTSRAFSFTFTDTGRFVVKLKVVNAEGCEIFLEDIIRVGQKLNLDFNADKRIGCYNGIEPVTLTGIENSGIPNVNYSYSWINEKTKPDSIGHGVGYGKVTNVDFKDTGHYRVRFMADHNGCISDTSKSRYITVHPARAFFPTVAVNCANDTILFENESSGKNKFKWYFGDGDSSELREPKHKYDTSGRYTVILMAIDTVFNCADTMSRLIVLPEAPRLNFSTSGSLGCAPYRVTLTNLTTVGPNAFGIVATQWVVNKNTFYNSNTAIATIFNPGYITIQMNLTDARNCKYSLKRDSVIRVAGGNARIGLTANRGCIPFAITAFDSSVTDFPVTSRKWVWSPTDSNVTALPSIGLTYLKPAKVQGNGYDVKLTVTDSLGCKFDATRKVVPTQPIADMSILRNLSCGSQMITYRAPTTTDKVCPPASYKWTIADQEFLGSAVTRSYAQLDTSIKLSLQITDSNACVSSVDTTIKIDNRKPKIGFIATPQKLDCYKPVVPISFFDTSIVGANPINKWEWLIGKDTTTKRLKNPSVTFPIPGNYAVSLKITDSVGCVDSLRIPDYLVIGGPLGTHDVSPDEGCVPHKSTYKVQSPNAKYIIWDLGNGRVDSVNNSFYEYTYEQPGRYAPVLTLVDSSGTCDFGYKDIDTIIVFDLPNPEFTSNRDVVCINTTITFENTTPDKNFINKWLWKIDSTDVSEQQGPVQKVFSTPGKYKITLIAQDKNGCIDSIVKPGFITVIDDTIPPAIPNPHRATVISNESNHFNFTKNSEVDFKSYRVYHNYFNGSPINYATIDNIEDSTYIQTNINTLVNPYSYSVAAIDVCNNISDASRIHTTVELTATPAINAVALKWTPYIGFDTIKQYEIWRNNSDSGNLFVYINQVSGDSLAYIDTTVTCFTTYYYKIKTIELNGNNAFSQSDTSGAVPIYEPTMPSTKNIRATVVNDRSVLLQWAKRTHEIKFTYVIYKMRDDETSPVLFKEVNDTFLLDLDVDVDNHSYTYFTYLKDACGGLSPTSNMAKTILLKVGLQENDILKYDPIIHFTKYSQWENGVDKYKADFYYDSAKAFNHVTFLNETDTQFFHKYVNLEQIDYCYKVTAFERDGNLQTSESNIACIETKPRLYAPNVFTINDDGLNDKFVLGGVFLESYHIIIYDRWGKAVFESFDIHDSWDGTIAGKPAPNDVYVYLAEGKGRKNQQITIKGNVTLIR